MRRRTISCNQTMSIRATIPLQPTRTATRTAFRRTFSQTAPHRTGLRRIATPCSLLRERLSTSMEYPPSQWRTTSSSSAAHRAVSAPLLSLGQSSCPRWPRSTDPLLQLHCVRTHLSKSLATAPLVRCGCAIGMGRYRPIHRCLPCNVVPVHVQSTPARGSLP